MDLDVALDRVGEIARAAVDPASGWASLLEYLDRAGTSTAGELTAVDLNDDVERLRCQLKKVWTREPPRVSLDAFYFGLFDRAMDDGSEGVGFYVCGVRGFDPNDGDTLCDPVWWPEGRYLDSVALRAIKARELASRRRKVRELLANAGQLGTALLLARFASPVTLPPRAIVVGFDSGDFVVLATT